ncbi:MAG: hypothetical protein E7306_07020 [Butyrivibrio sp.]|nr:hypothetical protein [Butyrivibrio sp.]
MNYLGFQISLRYYLASNYDGDGMNQSFLEQTNISVAYAGFYKDNNLLLQSSSGGVATELSSAILNDGGIVYGAIYADDYYSCHYMRVTRQADLDRLKGSKYVYVEKKVIYENEFISVFEAVQKDIENSKKVLFIGLSCDVAALMKWFEGKNINPESLYTIELLCDGVTCECVHQDYIKKLETVHNSKVVSFTVRNKRDGWTPLYIMAEFDNGETHVVPFYNSVYGYAFLHYKKKACYGCQFKQKNRFADLTIGDFWGCEEGMKEYNRNGVSIIYVQTEKGQEMLESIKNDSFVIMETDAEFALRHSPRYFNAHSFNKNWEELDNDISAIGLHQAVRKRMVCNPSERAAWNPNMNIILWGTGNCFHKLAPVVIENSNVMFAVDTDPQKWGSLTEYGILCKSPEEILKLDNVFVIIMIENASIVCQVIQTILDMNVRYFDQVNNWIYNNV